MDDKKIKLCLVAPVPPPYGGIGNWVLLMKKYMAKRGGVKLSIINTAPRSRGVDGRSLWSRVVDSGFAMLRQANELKELAKKERPDAVHITTSGQLALIRDVLMLKTAKRLRLRSVYHIRFGRVPDIAARGTPEWKLMRKAISLADVTVAIDSATFEAVKKHLPLCTAELVPNPIDLSDMPAAREGEAEKTVMFLGWVIDTKGIEELLCAWDAAHSKMPGWRLCVTGPYKEDYLNGLKQKYACAGVDFEGEKSHAEAMEQMARAGIFILPSHTEGFPNAVLEAMALARPIIASKVGAIPDMLSDGCGLLIDAKSAEQIEAALLKLAHDAQLRSALGQNARAKMRSQYAIDGVFARYMEIWRG